MHLNTHFGEIISLLKFVTFKQNYAFPSFFVPLPHTQSAPVGRPPRPAPCVCNPAPPSLSLCRPQERKPSLLLLPLQPAWLAQPSPWSARTKKLIISSPSLVAQHEGGGAAFSPNAVKAERPYSQSHSSPPVVDLLLLVFRRRRRRHNQHGRGTVLLPGRAGGGAGTGFSNLDFAY